MQPLTFDVCDQWSTHRPDLDTSPMEIIALLKWISWSLDGALAPLYEGSVLSMSELELVLPLRFRSGPTIARRLAEHLRLSPAAISKTLARLEKRGLIRRQPSPTNRRAALVYITEECKQAIDHIFPQQLRIEAALLEGLGDGRAQVLEALHGLYQAISQNPKAPVPPQDEDEQL